MFRARRPRTSLPAGRDGHGSPIYSGSRRERGAAGERSFATLGQSERPREKYASTGPAKSFQRADGFTLIELLIAASIFSIIILSIYSAFQTGILSYRRIDSAFELYQAARIALNRIESDLKNSFVYTKDDSGFKGAGSSLEFFSLIDSFENGQSFRDIWRIKYELSAGLLKRSGYKGQDALKKDTDALSKELSFAIKEISFKYAYATNLPENPYDWQESWPAEDDPQKKQEQQKALPLAVKIELTLEEASKTPVVFTKVVALPLSFNEKK